MHANRRSLLRTAWEASERYPDPEGKAIGAIGLPERRGECCFGGGKRNRLFMVPGTPPCGVYVGVIGA